MRDLTVTTNHMQCKCSDCLDEKARPSPKLLLTEGIVLEIRERSQENIGEILLSNDLLL